MIFIVFSQLLYESESWKTNNIRSTNKDQEKRCDSSSNCVNFSGWISLKHLILIDEKEKFDPSAFRDAIVQGLEEAGSDLDAVSKFLDNSGSKLDYRRYGEALFDILIAGGILGKRRILNLIL